MDTEMQLERKPLNVDTLVGCNGNWMVAYVYCNWGLDHVLFLLSRLDPDPESEESMINADVLNLPAGTQEEAYMVNQWLQEYPESPFIVNVSAARAQGGTFIECAKIMEERLAALNGDWDKFFEEAKEFDKWCRVAHYVANTEGAEYTAWYDGWRSLIDKI